MDPLAEIIFRGENTPLYQRLRECIICLSKNIPDRHRDFALKKLLILSLMETFANDEIIRITKAVTRHCNRETGMISVDDVCKILVGDL